MIRERPQAKNLNASEYDELDSNALPENEVELDVSVCLSVFWIFPELPCLEYIHQVTTVFNIFFFSKNLTEFNTAHNRRIANVGDIPDNPNLKRRKRKLSSHVHFNDEEEVINPGKNDAPNI